MSWNVQNLMDAKLDGSEYDEYKPGNGWDEVAYRRRLKLAADIIDDVDADLVLLQEVENSQVLADLSEKYLSRYGYKWYGTIKKKGNAIALGFLSKEKPADLLVHGVSGARSVLEIDFSFADDKLVVLTCHGKSRLGDARESARLRLELSKTLSAQLALHENDLVLCAGDFNGNVGDDSQIGQPPIVDVASAEYHRFVDKGSLCVSGDRNYLVGKTLYSPELDDGIKLTKPGTYYYSGEGWQYFDHIYTSAAGFDGNGMEFEAFDIYAPEKLCKVEGVPYAWDRSGLAGISDHFPVVLQLKK
ncbi:MAG: endonuclease/exonuclease/phosphatase family protein [Spirochaetia bacterium]|jgi:endonuclease/exonuclease/phosphatase family metal-dependent hydrolase|nr:endonuclease/exonuclease/phosphatase family protein [Spirochaetia bacterium]